MHRLRFEGHFSKGDVIEIYAKAIANLAPFDFLYPKAISVTGNPDNRRPDEISCGYSAGGYSFPLHAYMARQICDVKGPISFCRMERQSIPAFFRGIDQRYFELRNMPDGTTQAELMDSKRGLAHCVKVLTQVLGEPLPEKSTEFRPEQSALHTALVNQ